jgi:hypothetical protein
MLSLQHRFMHHHFPIIVYRDNDLYHIHPLNALSVAYYSPTRHFEPLAFLTRPSLTLAIDPLLPTRLVPRPLTARATSDCLD